MTDLQEWWAERIAIMTIDGGLNEHQATQELLRLKKRRESRQQDLLEDVSQEVSTKRPENRAK